MQRKESNQEPVETVELDATYMVMYRHFMMSGGVFDYGSVEIDDFYNRFKLADKAAKAIYKRFQGNPDLHVWIVRCLKTYCNGGIAVDKEIKRLV